MNMLANRILNLPPYLFAEVDRKLAQKRAEGVDVISLGIGDPDLPTPETVVSKLCAEAEHVANHRYPDYYGLSDLRAAIAAWYQQRFGISLDPNSEVLPLIGSKEGIAHMALAVVDVGDTALVPDPGYPVFSIGTMLAGGTVHYMPLKRENQFLPDFSAIPEQVAGRAKVMWLNYPNNPTGATAEPSFFEEAIAFAKEHDIVICHDMAYSEVSFDGYRPVSFLEMPGARDIGVEFHSLSKTYNMTGWRIGMVVGNSTLISGLGTVKTNIDSGVFQPVQYAAIEAFSLPPEWVAERNKIYQRRQDKVIETLSGLGVRVDKPRASLYIWPSVPEGYSSVDFCFKVLDGTGVWMTPGNSFGPSGEGYARISLTCPDDRLDEAMRRLRAFKL